MTLTQKENSLLCDLKGQEQVCIEKYSMYSERACDPTLKNLFSEIKTTEQGHLNTINRILGGEEPSGKVMVPQGFPGVEGHVMDSEIWWTVLDSSGGWKLEKNKVTGHCRIIDPDKLRKAWGRESEMRAAFEKVKNQLK